MKCKIILVTLLILASIYFLSQLLNELDTLHTQNNILHNQIVELQHRQQTLIESNKVQDKLIEETLMELHKPKPISEQKQVKNVESNIPQLTPVPLLLGGYEMVKKVLMDW